MKCISIRRLTVLGTASLALTVSAGVAQAALVYGVNTNNTLISFDSDNPSMLLSGKGIFGLAGNENVLGIDFRPTTGELYALGSFGNLYTLDYTASGPTAAATLEVASLPIDGSAFGFDFNPQADAGGVNSLRIVSDTDQNLAVNVDTGAVTFGNDVFYPNGRDPNIVGEAYTRSTPGGTTANDPTVQYAIDSSADQLVLQAFNAGELTTVGGLGVDTTGSVGFDIFSTGDSDTGFAALNPSDFNRSNFYEIDLETGEAIFKGEIGGGQVVPSISLQIIPEPATASLLGLAGLTLLRRRR